jgi:signal transduction histidine kinase
VTNTDISGETDSDAGTTGLFRAEWSVLGTLGRTALVALVLSAVVTVALAVAIPLQVERFLIELEAESLASVVNDLSNDGLISSSELSATELGDLDAAVHRHLLGREAVRVKLWAPDGTIVYSDAQELIGQGFEPSRDLLEAFDGKTQTGVPDMTRPENAADRELGALTEFYLPVESPDGAVMAVFEVYEQADPLAATVGRVRTYVWGSVIIGIGFLATFTIVLFLRNGREVTRRRREAERLLADLVDAQEKERNRVIGVLHDDIGQPLYRIHFGIEDCRARVEPGTAVDDELARLDSLVRDVEARLRSQLRVLRDEPGAEVDLVEAITELAETAELETGLSIEVGLDDGLGLSLGQRVTLYRAAQEGITNVRKHADATTISLRLQRNDNTIVLDVEDDGVGIDAAPGLGLVTARERLEALGGGLQVETLNARGTRFRAWMPVAAEQEDRR